MQGLILSGILLYDAWPPFLLPRQVSWHCYLLLSCIWLWPERRRGGTPVLRPLVHSSPWAVPDSWTDSCCPQTHTPGVSPALKPSWQEPPLVPLKDSVQWTSITVRLLQWKGGQGVKGINKNKKKHKMYNNRRKSTHTHTHTHNRKS